MKKLIIAAAMAVVAGGAFALDGYDFTATLKTTKGKTGKSTVTYYLGANQSGTDFWYNQTEIANYILANGVDSSGNLKPGYKKSVGGQTVPTIPADVVKNDTTLQAIIKQIGTTNPKGAISAYYTYKSAGKWCETYKFTDENCYRVAGSAKIAVDLYTTNCCETTVAFTNDFGTVLGDKTGGIYINDGAFLDAVGNGGFINRFGALVYAKATKVELFGLVKFVPTTDDRVFVGGALAGQGVFSKAGHVDSVSGNIVGWMMPTLCPSCCTLPITAIAFECDDPNPVGGTVFNPTAGSQPAADQLPTAAYGTFRLKYNAKNSD